MAGLIDLDKIIDWKEIFKNVKEGREEYIIKEGEEPVAVVIPFIEYEQWLKTKKEAKKEFFKLVEKIQDKTKGEDSAKIEFLIEDAIEEVRK